MYSAVHDIILDDLDLRVCANGTGLPILMLHDIGDSAVVFEHLTSAVCQVRRELVAVDLPGCGHSDPPREDGLAATVDHLLQYLPKLSEEPLDLVGHGFGGYLAASLAARAPDRIGRLILVDPLLPPRSGPKAKSRMSMGMAVNGAFTTLRRGKLRQNLAGLGRARATLDELAEADPQWWASLSRITAPTLVLGNSDGDVGERAVLDQLAAAIPHAGRDTVVGGRRPHVSSPTDFIGRILDFVDRSSSDNAQAAG